VNAAQHRGSHRTLLDLAELRGLPPARLDAIIVPSARTAPYLRSAIELARTHGCALLVLCSKRARVNDIAREVQAQSRHHATPIDTIVAGLPAQARGLPEFRTDRVLSANRLLVRQTDTSLKRNLGVLVAQAMGWRRVLFLDDDVAVPEPADLGLAASLLDRYDAVGLEMCGFPDNSVVCHANREAGGWQETFIGGGALVAALDRIDSFFPNIYNEDWFYLLGRDRLRPVTVLGRAIQRPYDPFANPMRARAEELGDNLAEGIFSLLDAGGKINDATARYWRGFLTARARFIDDILRRTEAGPAGPDQPRIIESLRAAAGRLKIITPQLCATYVEAWQTDRAVWRDVVARQQPAGTAQEALDRFGLVDFRLSGAPTRGALSVAGTV